MPTLVAADSECTQLLTRSAPEWSTPAFGPSPADITIYQGDDWAALVQVFLEDGTTPADLTGYTANAQIRASYADLSPEIVYEIPCLIQGAEITLSIPGSETTKLGGDYLWDLELISAENVTSTILAGEVKVILEVTRKVAAP